MGAIITVIGFAFALIALLPLVIPDLTLPSYWWFLAMITGVGLALVLLGLLVSARARSRQKKSRGSRG